MKFKSKPIVVILLLVSVLSLGACSGNRALTVQDACTATGVVAGTLIGSLIGAGTGNVLAIGAGAVGGGVAGNQLCK